MTARPIGQGGGAAERAAAFLMLPVAAVMRVVEVPFAWIQKRLGRGGLAAAFLAPNMLVFGIFVLVPLGINILYSFTTGAALFLENRTYTGADQYKILFDCKDYLQPLTCRNDAFWRSVHNTAFFVAVEVVALVVVSLITALVLNREMRARGFWRGVFLLPGAPVARGGGADLEVDPAARRRAQRRAHRAVRHEPHPVAGGTRLGDVLGDLRVDLGPHGLLHADPAGRPAGDPARPLRGVARWTAPGRCRVLRRITLPLLWPNLVVVIVLALIRGVQIFDEVYVLTGGGPGSSTQFLMQFIYQTGFATRSATSASPRPRRSSWGWCWWC